MYGIPGTTQPDHPKVQDDLSALFRPRHPRALEPLREHNLARSFGDARADRQVLTPVGLIVHPPTALMQIRIGVQHALVMITGVISVIPCSRG